MMVDFQCNCCYDCYGSTLEWMLLLIMMTARRKWQKVWLLVQMTMYGDHNNDKCADKKPSCVAVVYRCLFCWHAVIQIWKSQPIRTNAPHKSSGCVAVCPQLLFCWIRSALSRHFAAIEISQNDLGIINFPVESQEWWYLKYLKQPNSFLFNATHSC